MVEPIVLRSAHQTGLGLVAILGGITLAMLAVYICKIQPGYVLIIARPFIQLA